MTTALIYDPIFLEHITPSRHPETPQRLQVAMEALEALGWVGARAVEGGGVGPCGRPGLVQMKPRAATEDELAAVHDRAYIREVEEAARTVATVTLSEAKGLHG